MLRLGAAGRFVVQVVTGQQGTGLEQVLVVVDPDPAVVVVGRERLLT